MNPTLNSCDIRFMALASSYGCSFVSNVFLIISLVSNYWKEVWDGNVQKDRIEVHFGLHRVCFSTGDHCNNPGNSYEEQNYLPAIHWLLNIGLFFAMVANLVTLVNIAFDRLGKSYMGVMLPSVALPIIAALLIMIGVILFAENVEIEMEYLSFYIDVRLGWSFGLATSTVGLLAIAGALNCVGSMISPTPKFVLM